MVSLSGKLNSISRFWGGDFNSGTFVQPPDSFGGGVDFKCLAHILSNEPRFTRDDGGKLN